jgi:hypothetical protein
MLKAFAGAASAGTVKKCVLQAMGLHPRACGQTHRRRQVRVNNRREYAATLAANLTKALELSAFLAVLGVKSA